MKPHTSIRSFNAEIDSQSIIVK